MSSIAEAYLEPCQTIKKKLKIMIIDNKNDN